MNSFNLPISASLSPLFTQTYPGPGALAPATPLSVAPLPQLREAAPLKAGVRGFLPWENFKI